MKTIGKNSTVIEFSQEEIQIIHACINAAEVRWMKKAREEPNQGWELMKEKASELWEKFYEILKEVGN